MPPKPAVGDGKGIQSPTKEAGTGRGRRERRPSNDSLESIASEADSRTHLSTSLSSGSSSSANSSSSTPATSRATSSSVTLSVDEAKLLQSLIAKLPSASAAAPSAAHTVNAAPSTTRVPHSTTAADASLGRLLSGMSMLGLPSLPVSSTAPPGGIASTADDDEVDDDEQLQSTAATSVNDLKWNHIYVAERDRWAPSTIAAVRSHYQSFQGRATVVRCRDIRSKHEVDTLSAICDALLADRADVALEVAVRRIVGVEEADAGGGRDWDTATALDLFRPGALGNDDLRRRLRKDAAQIKSNRKEAATSSAAKGQKKKGTGSNSGSSSGNRGGSGTRSAGNTTAGR